MKSNPKKSKLRFMQINAILYHCIKTKIKNVFLFNFARELLISFEVVVIKGAGVLYQHMKFEAEAEIIRC